MKILGTTLMALFLAGCSIVGHSEVETAPYTLLKADEKQKIEVRRYDNMILVSTSMAEGRNTAFRKLFRYISGDNTLATPIAMTAPVFMDNNTAASAPKGTEIAMTAPVFMNNSEADTLMSFVMPKTFTLDTTPKPNDPSVNVSEVNDYTVAAIQFSGTLSKSNVAKYTKQLETWMAANGYTAASAPIEAGYNGPLTLPMLRRNEILISLQ
ncbi:SOUL family heme-binding protein [Alishewanella tabrizica]|uniref:SOUL heme-binding protein n=1 Tax=Alishewanella tabrizica TaxID=671278 RepID=A0ABQ2WF08_9ALTE|nr:heme-binding protein [Alishewanella tabrizica]GGW49806.1 SOUL heme-binding protein [Alishewanella tabrizica]